MKKNMTANANRQYVSQACSMMLKYQMKVLRLSHPDFSNIDAHQVANTLEQAASLRKLDLHDCPNLEWEGIQDLCTSLQDSAVTHLSIINTPMGDKGLQAVTELLKAPECRVKWLELEGIGSVDPATWREFFQVACRHLKSLDLSRNGLSSDLMHDLSDSMMNAVGGYHQQLSALILSENPIGDEGIAHLSKAIRHSQSIKMMAVGDCQVGLSGMQALVVALRRNYSLQRLYSYGNTIDMDSSENKEISYLLNLNFHGRGFLHHDDCRSSHVPRMIGKAKGRSDVIYGLLQEVPHMWTV